LQPAPEHSQKRAASAVTQQRQAYHHVGKMVPLDNGKQAHKQNFVGQRSSGYQGN
jgi:hypothetical protein